MSNGNWNDPAWCARMQLRLEVGGALSSIAGPAYGIAPNHLEGAWERAAGVKRTIWQHQHQDGYAFMGTPDTDPKPIEDFCASVRGAGMDTMVVLGIGGSALGTTALCDALLPPYHNLGPQRGGRVFVLDNVDPIETADLLARLDPRRTLFHLVSKSGHTVETNATIVRVLVWLREGCPESWRDHLVVTTDPRYGSLRQLVNRWGLVSFEIPEYVGGRYSVLTPVGLVAASFGGCDVAGLLAGAMYMRERIFAKLAGRDIATLMALLHHVAYTRFDERIWVLMPYARQLKGVADWWCQLVAESLGKLGRSRKLRTVGPTPAPALGTTDQHSQLQLYLQGLPDKLVTFLVVERLVPEGDEATDPSLDVAGALGEDLKALEGFDFLDGGRLENVMRAGYRGARWALARAERPAFAVVLPEINAFTIGQLLFMLEAEIAVLGHLFGVNPFDQPGVAEVRRAMEGVLGRAGSEALQELLGSFERNVVDAAEQVPQLPGVTVF
jgi:glucose-6-phosphate isomerase